MSQLPSLGASASRNTIYPSNWRVDEFDIVDRLFYSKGFDAWMQTAVTLTVLDRRKYTPAVESKDDRVVNMRNACKLYISDGLTHQLESLGFRSVTQLSLLPSSLIPQLGTSQQRQGLVSLIKDINEWPVEPLYSLRRVFKVAMNQELLLKSVKDLDHLDLQVKVKCKKLNVVWWLDNFKRSLDAEMKGREEERNRKPEAIGVFSSQLNTTRNYPHSRRHLTGFHRRSNYSNNQYNNNFSNNTSIVRVKNGFRVWNNGNSGCIKCGEKSVKRYCQVCWVSLPYEERKPTGREVGTWSTSKSILFHYTSVPSATAPPKPSMWCPYVKCPFKGASSHLVSHINERHSSILRRPIESYTSYFNGKSKVEGATFFTFDVRPLCIGGSGDCRHISWDPCELLFEGTKFYHMVSWVNNKDNTGYFCFQVQAYCNINKASQFSFSVVIYKAKKVAVMRPEFIIVKGKCKSLMLNRLTSDQLVEIEAVVPEDELNACIIPADFYFHYKLLLFNNV